MNTGGRSRRAAHSQPAPELTGKRALIGWVLFDGSCGFCRSWVLYWADTLRKRGFEIAPLQDTWVRERLALSDEGDLLRDLRVLLDRGVRCELLVYADEGHGLQKLHNKLDAYPKAVSFLEDVLRPSR